jgi:hypothetical protein
MDKSILQANEKLINWIENEGYSGYDPYDIKGTSLFLNLRRLDSKYSIPLKVFRRLIFSMEYKYPLFMRKLLKVKKEINAKAMGLFASAYLNLYKAFGDESYLTKAKNCLDWLENNPSNGYKGLCWGYPFDWQSLVFIARGTPSSVVSNNVGNAFFKFYKITNDKKYMDICRSICEFFLNDLNIDVISEDKICFSYTPLDYMHVHNTNLLIAEFLIKVGTEIEDKSFIEYGIRAVNYTLNQQNQEGAFYYFGSEDKAQYNLPEVSLKKVDHYHTGFVLRSLISIMECMEIKGGCEALDKGYYYYKNNLFEKEVIPKLTPQNIYPINIHSCSEAISCLSKLSKRFPESLEMAERVTRWTIQNMQDKKGYFYYMIYSKGKVVKIPYIRWAQAWMLFALSTYLYEESQ